MGYNTTPKRHWRSKPKSWRYDWYWRCNQKDFNFKGSKKEVKNQMTEYDYETKARFVTTKEERQKIKEVLDRARNKKWTHF